MRYVNDPDSLGEYDPITDVVSGFPLILSEDGKSRILNGPHYDEKGPRCSSCRRHGVKLIKTFRHEGYGLVGSSWGCTWCVWRGDGWHLDVAGRAWNDSGFREAIGTILSLFDAAKEKFALTFGDEYRIDLTNFSLAITGQLDEHEHVIFTRHNRDGDPTSENESPHQRAHTTLISLASARQALPELFDRLCTQIEAIPGGHEALAFWVDPHTDTEQSLERTRDLIPYEKDGETVWIKCEERLDKLIELGLLTEYNDEIDNIAGYLACRVDAVRVQLDSPIGPYVVRNTKTREEAAFEGLMEYEEPHRSEIAKLLPSKIADRLASLENRK